MAKNLSVFFVGLIFSLGLCVSGLIDPAKVLAFLDLYGAWDPSLILTMGGGLIVAAVFYVMSRRQGASVLGEPMQVPSGSGIDSRLIGGSVLFGAGWGLAGLCPGPALVNLGFLSTNAAIFVSAMLTGMALYTLISQPAARENATIDA